MAIYGIGIHPQDRWANRSANQFLIEGMTAEEWVAAGKGTFQQFHQLKRQTFQTNASVVFDQAAKMAGSSIMSFPLDGLLTTSSTIATKDFQQVLNAHSSWSYFSNIVDKGSSAGRVFGLDLETFGDIQKGKGVFGITELAIGERIYSDGFGKMADNNLSIAIGITKEQGDYLTKLVGDFEKKGWDALSRPEQVTLLRTSMYSGSFYDVFKIVDGSNTVFQNDKQYYAVNKLAQEAIGANIFRSGISNLRQLYDKKGITTHSEDILGDFIAFVKDRFGESSDTFKSLFYGANVKFDITGLKNEMSKYSSLRNEIGIIQDMGNEMLDTVTIVRAAAANLRQSVGSYIENFGSEYVGASVDEQIRGFTIGGVQMHFGALDLENEGNLVDFHKINTFDKYFAQSETLSKHLKAHSIEDTALFIRRGQIDKTTGAEFAYIPFSDDSPARVDENFSIVNEYWTFDTENSGIVKAAGQNGEELKYVITLKNYADELNELGDKATRLIITGDTQEELMERMSRIIDNGASEIFDKNSLTKKRVTQQQYFKYVDEGRREYDKFFSVGDVRSEYSSSLKKEVLTGGFDRMKDLYELHGKLSDDIDTVDKLHLALKDLYKDAKEFDTHGDPKGMPLYGRYQMQAFLEMRPRFNNESDLIEDIIHTVGDMTDEKGSTNLDRTIVAKRIYDEVGEALLVDNTFIDKKPATKTKNLSYFSDLYGLDLRDSQFNIHRVDAHSTASLASQLSTLFKKSSQDDINAMLNDLYERNLLSEGVYSDIYNHAQIEDAAYNVASDIAYKINDARSSKNKKWALQLTQSSLTTNQIKTYRNANGEVNGLNEAYRIIRGDMQNSMAAMVQGYNHATYVSSNNYTVLKDISKNVLQSINMGEGNLEEKAKLIAGMFSATEYDKPGEFKKYAINGRSGLQSFIVTPENGAKGNAYLFVTTNNKIGNLMEVLNSDKFKNALNSPTALRDSGIFEYGTFITLPHLNTYDIGNGKKLYSVNQGPSSEKFLMPELSVSTKSNGKLQGYYNDPEYSLLGLYRKVGNAFLDYAERGDFESAYRVYQREFNDYLEDKPASSSYRYKDGKRIIHFGGSDAMHGDEIKMHDGLEAIFNKMVVPGVIPDSKGNGIYTQVDISNLNTAQNIVNRFGQVLGMNVSDYKNNYDRYFKAVMDTHEFKEFLHRRMVFGSPSEEKWLEGIYGNEKYNQPIYQLIKDYANSEAGEKIFDKTLIDVINNLPPVDQITPLGSESAVKKGSYFTRKHGSYVPFAGNYSTMRPMYVQQLNSIPFDIDEMKFDVANNISFRAARLGREFSPISVGTQLLETDTYNMVNALKNIEGTFTGEHEFITRVKTMDIDSLQQAYKRVSGDKDVLIKQFQDSEIAQQISKTAPGASAGFDYSKIFNATLEYMQHEMGSTYQDKVFISSALQETDLFRQRDPVKLQFNLDSVDIGKTRKILNELVEKNGYAELDTDTIIGRRKNGTAIYYNKAKATLTRENIEELLSEETNGLTRLETRYGDIIDNKMFFNGMEKATVHSIDIPTLAKRIFGEQFSNDAHQLQIASAFSSYLFNELSDGALVIGSFQFGKHGGLVGSQSIWNTITKNYMEANEGSALISVINATIAKGKYDNLGGFRITDDGRLIGNTGLASNTSGFVDALYKQVQNEANNANSPLRELSQRIVNEVNDLIKTSSLNMVASRANMNEHLGVRLAVDQRMDQVIRMRGLTFDGLDDIDMSYADELRKMAESYDAKSDGLSRHGLNDLQWSMNDISVGRNYERIQRNSAQQNMRRSLHGVIESIDYHDSHFLEDSSLKLGAEYVHDRNIIEVGINDLLKSTKNKGNIHLLRSGGTIEDAEQGLFYINGKPSKYLQKLADEKGFILDDSVHSLWIDMSGYDVTVANKNGARISTDGFMLPIQNISDMASDDGKLFFQKQQGMVAHFVDEVADTILNNRLKPGETLSGKLGDLYSNLISELNEQTKLLDKDSDLYKAMQQYVLPNSHEFLALDEAAPLLNDHVLSDKIRQYNQDRKNALIAMTKDGGAYDTNIIQQYTEANMKFKEALQELADSVVDDKDVFRALTSLETNKTLRDATNVVIDGTTYHGLSVALSEEGIEKLGYSFGNVAMDVVADYEHMATKKVTIERLDDFISAIGGKDKFDFRIHELHGELQKEFSKELDELFYYDFKWDSEGNVTDALNNFMNFVRRGDVGPGGAIHQEGIELAETPGTFIHRLRAARSGDEFDINIRSINEDIARRAEKVFKQSGIGQDYFANIGTYSEFIRFPAFRSQPLVRLLLDKSMNGQGFMARITNPILSLLSNLDFDGDKIFLGNVANGSSVLRTDTTLFKQQDEIYKRFITNEAPELLREAIMSMDGYVADNPNDDIFQKARLLEIADGKAYDEGIRSYLNRMGLDENLNLKLAENAGILEAAVRSSEMDRMFKDVVPNTLYNTNMQVASLVARIRKNNIGYISTPNYKIREALMQSIQHLENQGNVEGVRFVSETLQNLTNMFSKAGGIFDMAEQKSIDVKHAKDGLDLSHTTRYSNAMYRLMSMDYAKAFKESPGRAEGQIYETIYSALRAIGPKTLGIKTKEEAEWFAKVLSERRQTQFSSDYLLSVIEEVQKGNTSIELNGRTIDKETAELLAQALPFTQLADIVRTTPQVTEIFKNIIHKDTYRSISAYLQSTAGKDVSEEEFQDLMRRTFDYTYGSSFGHDILETYIDSSSNKVPTFTKGNIYYSPYDVHGNNSHYGKMYVYEGMQDGQYRFAEITRKGDYKRGQDTHRARVTFDASKIKRLDSFVSPNGGMSLLDYRGNPELRNLAKKEADIKLTTNILNAFTISKNDRILTSIPSLDSKVPWGKKSIKHQPWGWKFAKNLFGGDDATIAANYETINKYAKAYELGLAHKIFGDNAPDSAAGMIRQINESIAKRPRVSKGNRPDYMDNAGSWGAEAYDHFARAFGGSSIFEEYLRTSNSLPPQFDPEFFAKQIEDFEQSLYNVPNEIAEVEASFDNLQSAIDVLKSDENMAEEVQRLQAQYDTRNSFIQQHKDFLHSSNKAKISILQNKIYGDNGIIKNEAQMDAVFNWRTSNKNNMLVGFGSYFGKSFNQLSVQDVANIRNEAEAILKATNGVPLNQLEQYAINTTIKHLGNVNPTTNVSAIKPTSLRSSPLTDTIKANDALIQAAKAKQSAQQQARVAQANAAQGAKAASDNVKKKTLSGTFFDSIKDMGITKKHVGLAVGAMAALGVTNKLLHKDHNKSPLARSESGAGGVPQGRGQSGGYQNGAPPSTRTVYHQDSRSGLNFKVSAKTKQRINSMNNGNMIRQAGGGNANIYTYNDTSGVTDNWLANKFAELAQ